MCRSSFLKLTNKPEHPFVIAAFLWDNPVDTVISEACYKLRNGVTETPKIRGDQTEERRAAMSVFEIEGVARREVACDIANVKIEFQTFAESAYSASKTAMDECDRFIDEIAKAGMDLKDIQYVDDDVSEARYHDNAPYLAKRAIRIRVPFEMEIINMIQEILQKGRFSFNLDINSDVSNRSEIRMELAKEALQKSKYAAEQLADVLGIMVIGVDSIRRDRWDDGVERYEENGRLIGSKMCEPTARPSNNICVKICEESVNLKVKWILE